MSDEFIALDEPALWQRWCQGGQTAGSPARRMPTVGDLEHLQERVRSEAGAEGLAEGRARAADETGRIRALLASIEQAHEALGNEIAEDVVTLAVELARQMLHEALRVRRELLLPVVREALRAMPSDTRGAQIVLNPADVELLRAYLGEELRLASWQVVEDHRVQPGGCRLISPHCEVDATLASRWKRVLAALGRDHGWLDN